MKKILSALLLIFVMLLSACGGVKYELKDGLMFADGKEATGNFEFKTGKYKVKGNFVNGLPDGLFEEYYEDGSIMAKETFVNGEMTSKELYYKNGNLLGNFAENGDIKLYYDDGSLILSYDAEKEESTYYHENGNPFMIGNSNETTLYNENNEVVSKLRDDDLTDIGATLKKLDDGTFELVKGDVVIAKIDANGEVINYLYSTGETLLTVNDSTGETEFFFKNGNTFMKEKEGGSVLNYRDGKPLYEIDGDSENIYNEEGDKIVGGFDLVTDIKKLD
ncbi:toxin-antitoxin system YwqK family antitoxin [Fusobacterium pseudoperiodonticum]|uniref:Cytoplasmic protein n=1 Tax=Fusobacterium pseudoperiodonticum TaxID=2663009 RepID=A0AAD0F1F0_9FUSO|nr:cytoplasmic protein [Fusobacterium pseudoperiodonticum]ATV36487.1 cytoplasmic protein [Fusobacterium pseudoperiodonticum]ATV60608.1 cytoplasmic protein [Fusobacterium pseudoperiodonticum]